MEQRDEDDVAHDPLNTMGDGIAGAANGTTGAKEGK